MRILYRVYWNGGGGGPIDYATPIATTSEVVFTPGPLGMPSDNLFAVRAFDADSGIEEENTDNILRIVLDSQGRDITRRPRKPYALFAREISPGSCKVSWVYHEVGQLGSPSHFLISIQADDAPDSDPISSMAPYLRGVAYYAKEFEGLCEGRSYTLRVISQGSEDYLQSEPATCVFVAQSRPDLAVELLFAKLRG